MELLFLIGFSFLLIFIINYIWVVTENHGYTPIWKIYENVNYFGFNLIIRIFWPTVYILLLSIIAYKFVPHAEFFIKNIWYIIPLYYILNLSIILFLGRYRFIEWRFMLLYYAMWSLIWYLVQNYFISKWLNYIIPDASSIISDLWLIIALFLFGIIQNQSPNYNRQESVRVRYIKNQYCKYWKKFWNELYHLEPKFKKILLSIMIYEDSNRPYQIRIFENLYHYFLRKFKNKKKISTWIMQVKNIKLLSDKDSIVSAIDLLIPTYKAFKNKQDYELINEMWKKYNWSRYSHEINAIFDTIHN
jgi:hypothetical protein